MSQTLCQMLQANYFNCRHNPVGRYSYPALQMRELTHREIRSFAGGDMGGKRKSQG